MARRTVIANLLAALMKIGVAIAGARRRRENQETHERQADPHRSSPRNETATMGQAQCLRQRQTAGCNKRRHTDCCGSKQMLRQRRSRQVADQDVGAIDGTLGAGGVGASITTRGAGR